MGITTSKDVNKDMEKNLEELLNYLLSEHMDNFLDKTFCEKTKLFYKDNVFMKYSQEDINQFGKEILIGKEVSNLKEKKEICEKLSNYYLKKLNLVASIYFIVHHSLKIFDTFEKGPVCFRNKKNDVSDILYQTGLERAQIIDFKDKHYRIPKNISIELNSSEIRKKSFNKYLKSLGKKKNHLPESIVKFLLVTELGQKQCGESGENKWLTVKEDLLKHNILPNPKVKKYNKSYQNIISKNRVIISNLVNSLLKDLNEVIEEKLENKVKTYIDKPLTYKKINEVIKKVKDTIEKILIQINITTFSLYNQYFVTDKELEEKKMLDNKINSSN